MSLVTIHTIYLFSPHIINQFAPHVDIVNYAVGSLASRILHHFTEWVQSSILDQSLPVRQVRPLAELYFKRAA